MIAQLAIIPWIMLFVLLFFVFWIIMLVDVIQRKFKGDNEQIVWILLVIFTGIVGSLIYYFMVYNKNKSLKWFWITILVLFIISLLLSLTLFYFTA